MEQIFSKIFLNNVLSTALKLFSDFIDTTIVDDVDKNSKDKESLPPSSSPEVIELLDTSSDDIKTKVTMIINICKEAGGTSENAVEVLRFAQKVLVQGKDLEIHDPTGPPPLGKTNYIFIKRYVAIYIYIYICIYIYMYIYNIMVFAHHYIKMGGFNLKICQNFVGIKNFLTFVVG